MCVVNLEGGFEFCLEGLKESRIQFLSLMSRVRVVKDLRSLGHPEYHIQIEFFKSASVSLPLDHTGK